MTDTTMKRRKTGLRAVLIAAAALGGGSATLSGALAGLTVHQPQPVLRVA